MATLNDNVYAKVREKIKEYNLTDQEIKAMETARDQLQARTRFGALVGASTAFFFGKYKKFNPFHLLALTGGGFLMGSQIGIISGAMAGIKTLNSLPNPQRLINIVKEVQMDVMKRKQNTTVSSVRPPQMSQQELDQFQNPQDQFSPESSNYQVEKDKEYWDLRQPQTENHSQTEPATHKQAQQSNTWDRIRSENLPNNTWSRIRTEAQQDAKNDPHQRTGRANKLRELSDHAALPRTREESASRGSNRRNQWGDLLD